MSESRELNQEVLVKLIDRLNSYPVGLPDSPEIREFLSIFLTDDEALLASRFPLREATSAEMARILNWDLSKADRVLEDMANKGAMFDYDLGGKRFWLLSPSIIGFIEFSLMKIYKDKPMEKLAELVEKYEDEHLWKEVFGSKTRMMRTLVQSDVPIRSEVLTYAQVEEIIKKYDYGAVQTCFCRQKRKLTGGCCEVADAEETCVSMGKTADFLIRRGFGRRMEIDELLAHVKSLGEKGLIHVADNVRDTPSFICNCCGCCCGLLAGMNKKDVKHSVSPSPYIMSVDEDACIGCGLCEKRCQVHAVSIANGKAIVDKDRCLGCGACTKACKKDAMTLIKRKKVPKIPKNATIKYVKIAYEKGRLWPLLKEAIKSKLHSMR